MSEINLNEVLTKAILIATKLHDGQVDKAGQPYILHPLRVMTNIESIEGKIVGVLHDTIEDCDITYDKLIKEGIPEYLVEKLPLLTKNKKEKYFDYILRAKSDKITREVKDADLDDNLDLSRIYPQIDKSKMHDIEYLKTLDYLNEKDIKRVEKYLKAKDMLNQ